MSKLNIGDRIFHKSNPMIPMVVVGIEDDSIECEWVDSKGKVQRDKFIEAALERFANTQNLVGSLV
jgi:uncharacterized protein YodC (DUF2158 family)